ncbi:Protein of unknown function [bacterium A37T11]|nr:Protein of unknown function [bacterium A37T11]
MKYKNLLFFSLLGFPMLIISCSHDNYLTPNGEITGAIVDNTTGSAVLTEQPNGMKIRLLEVSYGANVTPIDFWAKPDGTFENANVFAGKYKVVPIEGAFFPADTATVDVKGQTEVNFKVTPFLVIDATLSTMAGGISASYQLSREKIGDKIVEAKIIVSEYPSVGNTINEYSVSRDLSATADETVLVTHYTDKVTGLTSEKVYYARVAARTNNANKKYNYSEVVKLTIP